MHTRVCSTFLFKCIYAYMCVIYIYIYLTYVYTYSRIRFPSMDNVNSGCYESHTAVVHGMENQDKKEKTDKQKMLVLAKNDDV